MNPEEWDKIPLGRKIRLLESIKNLGVHCIDCKEHLTLVERLHGRVYCTDCFPEELEHEG